MNDILAGGIVAVVFLALGLYLYGHHAHTVARHAGRYMCFLNQTEFEWLLEWRELKSLPESPPVRPYHAL